MQHYEFALTRPLPLFLRLPIGAAGLFAIVMPVWEFRQAFLHPGLASLFFAVIVLGAWSVGGAFLYGALYGEDQRWRIEGGKITVERKNIFRQWTTILRPADISHVSIVERDSDSGPNLFCVRLETQAGEAFETAGFEKRENAEALKSQLLGKLDLG